MVARIVHGSKVKAELLPWHFKANILKTTLRFVELLKAFVSGLSAFADCDSPGLADTGGEP
ncbi:MAG: hypothetical protein DWH99_12455 [Planctomycetota bacterium]|nr:MAG: hypothetical protein DWH99_12455 [Planctomycetota bacterium]